MDFEDAFWASNVRPKRDLVTIGQKRPSYHRQKEAPSDAKTMSKRDLVTIAPKYASPSVKTIYDTGVSTKHLLPEGRTLVRH